MYEFNTTDSEAYDDYLSRTILEWKFFLWKNGFFYKGRACYSKFQLHYLHKAIPCQNDQKVTRIFRFHSKFFLQVMLSGLVKS